MKVLYANKPYTIEDCRKNPDHLYVYEEDFSNDITTNIRHEPNAFGIPTRNKKNGLIYYFRDRPYEYDLIDDIISELKELSENYTIVLPYFRIGTGASFLSHVSPDVYNYLIYKLDQVIDTL